MTPHFLAPGLAISGDRENLGKGVFALRPFAAGELLAIWGGCIITTTQIAALDDRERAYVLQVEDDQHLLTPPAQVSTADFINHSCDPNAGLSGPISLIARQPIRPGEEICYDYAMSDSNPFLDFRCHCGSAFCRGHITGEDWRLPGLQSRYNGFFSPYLERRISAQRVQAAAPRRGDPTGLPLAAGIGG
jgi:hypothetical protein